ncbi:MAG: energy transducer TonB, partial [Pseudomonadota bacterium]
APRPAPAPAPAAAPTPVAMPESMTPPTRAPAPPLAPPAAPAPAPVPVAIEPPRYQAAYLDNPQPAYPVMSRKLREQGLVRLRVRVDREGRPETVNLLASSGFARLDEAATRAVQTWRFEPARQGGHPLAAWVEVPIRFNLER